MSKLNLAELRKDYKKSALDENSVAADPLVQFQQWFGEAQNAGVDEPNAMCLSTVNEQGRPSSRIVLLKDLEEGGFVFYTNYESRKAAEISASGYAALNFLWLELERQVRVEGRCIKAPEALSDAYFNSRPLGSRIGAIASPQSRVIEGREKLETRVLELEERYKDHAPQRPDNWGGFIVIPDRIEFWQGRPSRLHDRIEFLRGETGWTFHRLAP